jgi:peptidoglycan-N-acetylglucosamine deacetylase
MKHSALLASLVLCLVGAVVYFTSLPQARTGEKIVALTFDDGPNPGFTQKTLALLKRHGAHATFFALGRNLQMHRSTALAIAESGNELANHAYSHQVLSQLPFKKQKEEILATEKEILDLGVAAPILVRTPYGVAQWPLRPWLWLTGRKLVWWDVSVSDFLRHDPRELAKALTRQVRPGAIFLLHDGEGNRAEMLQALDWFLAYLKTNGYKATTVSDLLARSY